jgi:hypothetical protein
VVLVVLAAVLAVLAVLAVPAVLAVLAVLAVETPIQDAATSLLPIFRQARVRMALS